MEFLKESSSIDNTKFKIYNAWKNIKIYYITEQAQKVFFNVYRSIQLLQIVLKVWSKWLKKLA